MPALTKNEMPPTTLANPAASTSPEFAHAVENGDRRRQGVAELLDRRRPRFLQMIGADVHRIPLRRLARAKEDQVLGQAQRRAGRKYVGAARQIFLDDVVLGGAGELAARRALFVGDGDIERHQPGRGGVDRHRRVHRGERDVLEKGAHVADMGDRHADLADFAAGQRMIAVVAGLGRQIEGDGEAGLALGEIGAIEAIGLERGRMAGVGAENPRLVARRRRFRFAARLHPAPSPFRLARFCAQHNRRKSR